MKQKERKHPRDSNKQLLKFLDRFTKKDIITNIWPKHVEKQDIYVKKTKPTIIKETLKILLERFSDMDALNLYLHLQYAACVKQEKQWIVLLVKNAKRFRPSLTVEKVSSSILKYFTKYDTECKVLSEIDGCCIWIVLLLESERNPIYCIVHMKLSLIFVYNLKPAYSFLTEKVLRKTFRGSDIKRLITFKTRGRNIVSLTLKTWNYLYKEIVAPNENKNASDNEMKHNKILNKQNIDSDSEMQSPKKRLKRINLKERDKETKQVRQTEFEECEKSNKPVRQIEFEELDEENELVRQIQFEEYHEENEPVRQTEFEECDEENEPVRQTEFEECDEETESVKQTEFDECDEENEPVRQIEESDQIIQNLEFEVISNDVPEEGKSHALFLTYVKFQGTNILKGLNKLIECGIADASLRDRLNEEIRNNETKCT